MFSNQWTMILILIRIVLGDNDTNSDAWDNVHMICPNQCVCQESPLMDLSVARWIEKFHGPRFEDGAFNEEYNNSLRNRNLKFVMCQLQDVGNFSVSVLSLPQDVQVLVLLHNGNGDSNFAVSSSDLLQLTDLELLEIRGTGSNRNLIFDINEIMPNIKYANFELIELIADENLNEKYLKSQQHPSDTYDYVPKNERSSYDVAIEVDEDIQIVPYDVYVQEMKNIKRATFIGWQSLEILRVHDCQMNEIYWEMFDGLVKLQHLSLENNDIRVVPEFAIYGALNLKSLCLARNNILDLGYRALAGLLDLEYLDLSMNNLTKLSELTFPPFPKLKSANLRGNPIESIFPMTFGIMNATKELILGSESIALDLSESNEAFLSLDNMISLNLLNITASGSYQSTFAGLKKLRSLRMKGSLSVIEYDAFSEMSHLAILILRECNLSEISMDAFYGVKSLRIVDLSNNHLTSIPPGIFDEQNQLQEVYLQKNHLKNLPKDFFALRSLKLVRLTKNPWFCTCGMSDWKQEITNSVRTGILNRNSVDADCIRNSKTGEIVQCNGPIDEVPENSYGFDNRMSPVCFESKKKKRSVYWALRHTIKCGAKSMKPMKKRHSRTKSGPEVVHSNQVEDPTELEPINSWNAQQKQRKPKLKSTVNEQAEVHKEKLYSQIKSK